MKDIKIVRNSMDITVVSFVFPAGDPSLHDHLQPAVDFFAVNLVLNEIL